MLHRVAYQLFLLSPAYCGGRRAGYLLREGSTLPLAMRLAAGTLTLGEAFSFMSGLYFRGKLGYAQAFGRHETPALVITPTRGLLPPETLVTPASAARVRDVDVDADDRPLSRGRSIAACGRSRDRCRPRRASSCWAALRPASTLTCSTRTFGERLHFPSDFVGRGDMSRGGLMLRCVAPGPSSTYTVVSSRGAAPRHAPAEAATASRDRDQTLPEFE